MRIYFPEGKAAAQSFCDKTHAQMIAADPLYAKSAQAGQTLRWDAPRQNLDAQDKSTGDFFVIVKDRVDSTLTISERGKLVAESIKGGAR